MQTTSFLAMGLAPPLQLGVMSSWKELGGGRMEQQALSMRFFGHIQGETRVTLRGAAKIPPPAICVREQILSPSPALCPSQRIVAFSSALCTQIQLLSWTTVCEIRVTPQTLLSLQIIFAGHFIFRFLSHTTLRLIHHCKAAGCTLAAGLIGFPGKIHG